MAADVHVDFEEAHFTFLPSQPNIYSLARITAVPGANKVLVASLNGRVSCVEYTSPGGSPSAREVPFTYIPAGDAEIISMDAFVRPLKEGQPGLVVGISLILLNLQHNALGNQKQFLNIYSSVEKDKETCLDSIAEGCQLIELDFVPFQLCHAEFRNKSGTKETVFLLAGSDHRVHMFREVLDKTHQSFEEQPSEIFFPELQDLQSNVIWLDIRSIGSDKRLTAIGCQSGLVHVSLVDTSDEAIILQTWRVVHDGPVTSVNLFTLKRDMCALQGHSTDDTEDKASCYHLLVCCATEPCVMYMDIIKQGLSRMVVLPDSDKYDCVLCTCVADVDWDGCNELLLGTYGQELLVYKFAPLPGRPDMLEMHTMWRRSFPSPLYAVDYLDMTGDGLREVVVASQRGVHILQHKLDDATHFFTSKIKTLTGTENLTNKKKEKDVLTDKT